MTGLQDCEIFARGHEYEPDWSVFDLAIWVITQQWERVYLNYVCFMDPESGFISALRLPG
jgi:hypothetical protein